jgi:hypothetical protein
LIALVATGLVAVLFQPLRERLQRGVNRLLYGERDHPYAVLVRLGRRLEATLAPDAVLTTIVQTIQEALKLPYTAIALATTDEGQAATNDSSFVGVLRQLKMRSRSSLQRDSFRGCRTRGSRRRLRCLIDYGNGWGPHVGSCTWYCSLVGQHRWS